jgi:hypothetical protein
VLPDCGKDQCHPVTNRKPNEAAGRFGAPKTICAADDLTELLLQLAVIVD